MSWRTAHYEGKRRRQFHNRCRTAGGGRRGRRSDALRRTDCQEVISRVVAGSAGGEEGTVIEKIFGVSSLGKALRIALRIKKAKGRDPHIPLGEVVHPSVISNGRSKVWHLNGKLRPDRNVHHLTPKSRKEAPFFGNYRCNLLLMKVSRHDALHDEFGTRTWEEIIMLLSRCIALVQHMNFAMMVEYLQCALGFRKKACRRIARQMLRDLRSGIGSGIFGADFVWNAVGPLGIEPSRRAPKARILPVYDGPEVLPL